MRLLFVMILCFVYFTGIAQKKQRIVDSSTKGPIPYASVSCIETGYTTMANEKGEWMFPDSIRCKSVRVSCAGYNTVELIHGKDDIVLSPLIIRLTEVTVGSKKEEVSIDNIRKTECAFGFNPEKFSTTYGAYLPNSVKKAGSIKELSFHVSSFHKPDLDVPVRIRFFEWNEKTQMPGEEISTSNLILKPSKKGWNKINLEEAYQDFPENGIVVAFELLSAGPSHYHEYKYRDKNRNKQTGKYYGWYLTASCCSDCEVKGFHYGADKWYLWNKIGGNSFWAPAVKLKMSYYQ